MQMFGPELLVVKYLHDEEAVCVVVLHSAPASALTKPFDFRTLKIEDSDHRHPSTDLRSLALPLGVGEEARRFAQRRALYRMGFTRGDPAGSRTSAQAASW